MTELTQNYHTHTYRCGHARGEDREYVEAAIKAGIKILGFSDHSPMIYNTDFKSGYRVRLEAVEGYFSSLLSLKEEYKNDIDIRIGFEAEYYPEIFDKFIDYISGFPTEYLVLGQHFLWREEDGIAAFPPSDSEEKLKSFHKNLLEAVKTGKFMYIAHPDVLNFTGDKEIYRENVAEFLTEIKKYDIPIGINRYGLFDKRHYPNHIFWEVAGKIGNRALIELDAHSPDVFADKITVEAAEKFASAYGVNLIYDLSEDYKKHCLLK